jgi:hypothetical protein
MMAMTTSSSMSVKPRLRDARQGTFRFMKASSVSESKAGERGETSERETSLCRQRLPFRGASAMEFLARRGIDDGAA